MSQVTIRIRDNGPLLVEGPFTVVDAAGNAFTIPTGKWTGTTASPANTWTSKRADTRK